MTASKTRRRFEMKCFIDLLNFGFSVSGHKTNRSRNAAPYMWILDDGPGRRDTDFSVVLRALTIALNRGFTAYYHLLYVGTEWVDTFWGNLIQYMSGGNFNFLYIHFYSRVPGLPANFTWSIVIISDYTSNKYTNCKT